MARAGGQNLIMNIGAEAKRKKRFDSFGFIMLADAVFMAHAIQAWHNYAWTDIIYYCCSDVNRAISNGAHYTAQGYFGQHHQGPQGPALACTRLKLSHLPYFPGALQTRTSNPPSVGAREMHFHLLAAAARGSRILNSKPKP
jgi:hypothetical protein